MHNNPMRTRFLHIFATKGVENCQVRQHRTSLPNILPSKKVKFISYIKQTKLRNNRISPGRVNKRARSVIYLQLLQNRVTCEFLFIKFCIYIYLFPFITYTFTSIIREFRKNEIHVNLYGKDFLYYT